MFGFWLIAALLLLISLFVISITLLRTHDEKDLVSEKNTDLYEQRLAEIEQDINNGLLSGTEAKEVKKELQLTLLNEDESKEKIEGKESSSSTVTAILLLIVIPIFAIGLYQHLGQPELIQKAELLSDFHNAKNQEEQLSSIEDMLTQLEQRLINEPDDVDGWLMLTNSYSALERYPDALRAVNNLYRLRSDDPTVIFRYADILSMVNDGMLAGKPTELLDEGLKIDPENTNGLWLAGLAANERGDNGQAIIYWQRLVPKLKENSKSQQQIKKYIEMAGGPAAEMVEETSTAAMAQEYKIQVNVSLSSDLIDEANGDDTIFIYAQAISGPPMPIAAVRKKVSDLPLQVTLDDSMAMMPTNKLSDHKQVKITARISKSGNAIAASGDLIGTLEAVQTDTNESINLNIDQKIP